MFLGHRLFLRDKIFLFEKIMFSCKWAFERKSFVYLLDHRFDNKFDIWGLLKLILCKSVDFKLLKLLLEWKWVFYENYDFILLFYAYTYLCGMSKNLYFNARIYLWIFFGLFVHYTRIVLTHLLSDLGFSPFPFHPGFSSCGYPGEKEC